MLYFLNAGVFRMSINDSQLPATAFIPGTSGNFYGLGIHPISGDVYVSDAIDFVQQGKVLRYSSAGTLSSDFTVGIIPGDFLFVP
jgi:hypothetical protein